jgi:hypothetical protein
MSNAGKPGFTRREKIEQRLIENAMAMDNRTFRKGEDLVYIWGDQFVSEALEFYL